MSRAFISRGDVMTFTAPSGGVVAGTGVLIGNLLVIPQTSAAQGLPFDGYADGVVTHAKAGSQAWTEGAIVYWDNTAKVFTTTSTANYRAGCAVVAVGSGAGETTGIVRLAGIPVTAVGGAAP